MKDRVLQYLIDKGEATPHEIAESTGFSRQYVQRKLLDLLDNTQVIKIGKPPLVYYQIIEKPKELVGENVEESDRLFLEGQFIEITEDGRFLEGLEAFIYLTNPKPENCDSKLGTGHRRCLILVWLISFPIFGVVATFTFLVIAALLSKPLNIITNSLHIVLVFSVFTLLRHPHNAANRSFEHQINFQFQIYHKC